MVDVESIVIEADIDNYTKSIRIEIERVNEDDMTPQWMYRLFVNNRSISNPPYTFSKRDIALHSAYNEIVKIYGDKVKQVKRSLTIMNILND